MAKPKSRPYPWKRTLSRYGSDYFWWYSDTNPVEVKLEAGDWTATEVAADPNEVSGYRLPFRGPDDDSGLPVDAIALVLGENKGWARVVGSGAEAAPWTITVT
jgi:hypothetical protein